MEQIKEAKQQKITESSASRSSKIDRSENLLKVDSVS